MLNSYVFEAGLEWKGGRAGEATSQGLAPLEVSAPPEFQGEPGLWSPEHLLVASTASCLMTTFLAIAELSRLPVNSLRLRASGRLDKFPGAGYRFTEIRVAAEIGVPPEQVEKARRVMEKAEKNCFISNSLRAEVHVDPTFVPLNSLRAS